MKIKDILDNMKMVPIPTPPSIVHILEEDLMHCELDDYIFDNTMCYELSENMLFVTDLNKNYLFTYKTYCKHPSCFCSKGYVTQQHHENVRKFKFELWEKFRDPSYQINEYEEITEDTEIVINN